VPVFDGMYYGMAFYVCL